MASRELVGLFEEDVFGGGEGGLVQRSLLPFAVLFPVPGG